MQTRTEKCRHGTFTFFEADEFVGRSLALYGEFSPGEALSYEQLLTPKDVAVEVGANIGALTLPMSRQCRKVLAFEPQIENFELLTKNLRQNHIQNVEARCVAIGDKTGIVQFPSLAKLGHSNFGRVEADPDGTYRVLQLTLDTECAGMHVNFIKIDVEGHELEVLNGAVETIARCKPILYVENDRREKSGALVGWLIDHGYRCYWHRPTLFYPDNYRNNKLNAFGDIVSLNMLCVHEDSGIDVGKLEEVDDHRIDAQMYARNAKRLLARSEKNPDDLESRFMAAHYLNMNGEHERARAIVANNLRRNPNDTGSRAIAGLFDLQDGKFATGWPAYELRYSQHNPESFGFRYHKEPRWDGKPTDDVVLVWCEQGFGDVFMFIRFAFETLRRAPNAVFEVYPAVHELLERTLPPEKLIRRGRTLPEYKQQCSIPSLPAVLGLTTEEEVRINGPYLFADKTMAERWRRAQNPRIGICLHGSPMSERAYSRDMPESAIEPLSKFGPFMSFEQKGQYESYMDTAAALMSIKLLLTVDTSVAHLAGALGVPVWLMLSTDPDWRWQLRRHTSPWYPTMRIFRQTKFMEWGNVIDEVGAALQMMDLKKAG